MDELIEKCNESITKRDEFSFEVYRDKLYDKIVKYIISSGNINVLYYEDVYRLRGIITSKDNKINNRLKLADNVIAKNIDNAGMLEALIEKEYILWRYMNRPESLVDCFSGDNIEEKPFTVSELKFIKGVK